MKCVAHFYQSLSHSLSTSSVSSINRTKMRIHFLHISVIHILYIIFITAITITAYSHSYACTHDNEHTRWILYALKYARQWRTCTWSWQKWIRYLSNAMLFNLNMCVVAIVYTEIPQDRLYSNKSNGFRLQNAKCMKKNDWFVCKQSIHQIGFWHWLWVNANWNSSKYTEHSLHTDSCVKPPTTTLVDISIRQWTNVYIQKVSK